MIINTFKQAEAFLALHIPKKIQQRFPGELGLKRTKYFLQLLGNPQEKLKIIHVAGTSGKGSTCYLISSLLKAHGFKVGFHQSPHLTDVRERFQIYTSTSLSTGNQIISKEEFIFYLNKIIPIINLIGKTFHGSLTYFEILVGLAYFIFYDKKVDYAVMETGLGGKYDGTNVVDRSDKLAVLTKIGFDHMEILGKTLPEIALQKAMIINKNSQAISINQLPNAKKVIEEVAIKKQAKVFFVTKNNYLYHGRGQDRIKLNLIGNYQRENASLALAVIKFLSKRDGFLVDQEKIKKVFATVHFPGRFDIKKISPKGRLPSGQKTVIFDAAHNPQKMAAFTKALIKKYPGRKFNFLLAFKSGKDYKKMLKIIIPWADSITLTSFFTENQDMINLSEKPTVIGQQLRKIGFNNFTIVPSNKKAWEIILNKKEPIIVTGSLYLIGEIYRLIKNK